MMKQNNYTCTLHSEVMYLYLYYYLVCLNKQFNTVDFASHIVQVVCIVLAANLTISATQTGKALKC
jgi:hypothetical protein